MRLCLRMQLLWRWQLNTSEHQWSTWSRWDTVSATIYSEYGLSFSNGCCLSYQTGFPSREDHPSCVYSRVDFDSDEDFNAFFNCKFYGHTSQFIESLRVFSCIVFFSIAFRAQQGEVVRSACRIVPLEAFQIAAEWLRFQIASPIDIGDTTCKYFSSFLTYCHKEILVTQQGWSFSFIFLCAWK